MRLKTKFIPLLLILALFFCACSPDVQQNTSSVLTSAAIEPSHDSSQAASDQAQLPNDTDMPAAPFDEVLQVIIFDVGQADCALVKIGEHAMLIDAGDTGQDGLVTGYLADTGVTKLDYLVATHPHADHIGSMAAVIGAMDDIETLLMPDVIHTTATFEKLLDAIEEKDIDVTIPQPGDTFEMGGAKIQSLAPNGGSYTDLNNYSIALRIQYGQIGFLFTGDAEDISESEQLAAGYVLGADVLKVGHHGSHSSTTQRYLDSVAPSYAVISCGKGNSYGHPHSETVSRLAERGVTLYRTDENGTVSFTTDGETITVNTERVAGASSATSENTQENAASYIGNQNSHIFHLPTCGTLPAEKNRVYFDTKDKAIESQYRPCKKCNP